METPKELDEKEVEVLEEMIKPVNIEFQSEYKRTDEYDKLFAQAQALYPDMPPFFIQMALLSHLEEIHNTPKNI